MIPKATPNPSPQPCQALTHVIHNSGLGSLAIEINDSIDTRGYIPGSRALSHSIDKEVESSILTPYHAHCVPCLGRSGG